MRHWQKKSNFNLSQSRVTKKTILYVRRSNPPKKKLHTYKNGRVKYNRKR